jgi:hypothetical protein
LKKKIKNFYKVSLIAVLGILSNSCDLLLSKQKTTTCQAYCLSPASNGSYEWTNVSNIVVSNQQMCFNQKVCPNGPQEVRCKCG